MALSKVASFLRRRVKRRAAVSAPAKRFCNLAIERLEDRLAPATKIWTGFGLTNNMTNPQNWLNNVAPVAGDDLIFPPSIQTLVNNDFVAGTQFNSLTISGQAYTIGGLTMQLANGIYNSNRVFNGSNTITLDIDFVGTQTVSSTLENSDLFINGTVSLVGATNLTLDGAGRVFWQGVIDGNGSLTKNGIGQHFLRANNAAYNGTIIINNGVLYGNQQNAFGNTTGATLVNNGGTMGFEGGNQFENVTAQGLGFGGQGALNAVGGTNFNGTLTVTGDIALGTNFNATIHFNQSGTGGAIVQSGGSHDLTKVGVGNLRLDAVMGLTGEFRITGGLVQVVNNGTLLSSKIIINSASQLEINNTGTPNSDRIPNTTNIELNSGFLNVTGKQGTTVQEFVGSITLVGGYNQIRMDGINTTTGSHLLLQSTALLRNDGATVRFTQAGIVLGSTNANFSNRILFSAAPGLTSSGTSGGILPYAHRDVGQFVTYLGAAVAGVQGIVGIVDAGAGAINQPEATIAAAAATNDNVRSGTSETIASNTLINSFNTTASVTITINAGVTLTIGSGGVLNSGGTLTFTGAGTLRFNSPTQLEGFIFSNAGTASNFRVVIDGPGLDSLNVSAEQEVDINFGNNAGGELANAYDGVTRINGGDLFLNKPSNILAVPGDMIVGDGSAWIWFNTLTYDRILIPDGRFGQIANTLPSPTIAAAIGPTSGGVAGGSLAAGMYYLVHTFYNGLGETIASVPSASFVVAAGNIPRVVLPVGPPGSVNGIPSGAVGVKIYLSDPLATPGSETFYGSFLAGITNIDLVAAHAPSVIVPPLSNTTRPPDLTIKGGGIMDMPNTTGLRYTFRNVTMQAGNSAGGVAFSGNINDSQGDAMLQTENSIVAITGTVTVLKPFTTSYLVAGRAHIGFGRGNYGVGTNTLELGVSGSGDRVFNIEDGAQANDMIISNIVTDPGDFRLVKDGLGTLQLRVNNGYDQETVVNAGRLAVYGNNSNSSVTVGPGAEVAGGLGATNVPGIIGGGFVNISGTVRPGATPDANEIAGSPDWNNDTRGILQSNSGVNFLPGSTLVLEIAGFTTPGRDYDRFVVGGSVNITTGTTLVLDLNGVSTPGTIFGVLTYLSRFGQFANVILLNNLLDLHPLLSYNSSSLDITFVDTDHLVSNNTIAIGPNKKRPGDVQVWDGTSNSLMYTIPAFSGSGHVEVAVGDWNNDSVLDIIAAQKGVIKVFDGTDEATDPPIVTFKPFGASFAGVVYIALGDFDAQVGDDIVAGRGSGKSTVRGWSSHNFSASNRLFQFNAYPGTSGVRVAAGNTNGAGDDEIVTVPGNKQAVEVRVYDTAGILLDAFQPYGAAFKKGSYVATGDLNNDGKDDVVVGPGGHNPGLNIMVLDGNDLTNVLGTQFVPFPGATQPIRVAVGDFDNDFDLDIIAALATTGRTVKGFDINGNPVDADILAFDATFNSGLCIGAAST